MYDVKSVSPGGIEREIWREEEHETEGASSPRRSNSNDIALFLSPFGREKSLNYPRRPGLLRQC